MLFVEHKGDIFLDYVTMTVAGLLILESPSLFMRYIPLELSPPSLFSQDIRITTMRPGHRWEQNRPGHPVPTLLSVPHPTKTDRHLEWLGLDTPFKHGREVGRE